MDDLNLDIPYWNSATLGSMNCYAVYVLTKNTVLSDAGSGGAVNRNNRYKYVLCK